MQTSPGWSGSLPATGWSSSCAEALGERDMLGLADLWSRRNSTLCASSASLIVAEQIVVARRLGEVDPDELGADVRSELLDPHQITKIDEPVVLPASRSLCAWTASSSS